MATRVRVTELDHIVPHPVIENYRAAFLRTRSMTYRVIQEADHSLSKPEWSEAYTTMLVKWMTEMLGLAQAPSPLSKK